MFDKKRETREDPGLERMNMILCLAEGVPPLFIYAQHALTKAGLLRS